MNDEKQQILQLLSAHVAQRSGMDPRNYGSYADYRREQREVTKDRHHFDTLMRGIACRSSITAADLREGFRAFSGRLSLTTDADGRLRLDYCTGGYFPTEYRKAACAVLAEVLWDYTREACNANVDDRRYGSLGDEIRTKLRREFGRSIADRYFR